MAPQIKARLESDLFTGNEAVTQAKLDACLARDPAHIMRGDPSGSYISVIQTALRRIAAHSPALGIPAITDDLGQFGDSTYAAVWKFKELNDIKRPGAPLDGVVGRMTITQLDNDMKAVEAAEGQPKPAPVPKPVGRTQDVYIRYQGFDWASQAGRDLSDSPDAKAAQIRMNKVEGYLDLHSGLKTVWFVGGDEAIVQKTVDRVLELQKSAPLGRVVMIGGSAGGKNILQVAEKLATNGVAMHYVGICDGAFQKEDKSNPAQDNVNALPLLFKSPNFTVVGNKKRNWFQSWGHTLDPNQELHGKVAGFNDEDLTDSTEVKAVRDAFNNGAGWGTENSRKQKALEAAHTAAYLKGFNVGLTEMRTVMISDLPKPK